MPKFDVALVRSVLESRGISIHRFSILAGVPKSTLYGALSTGAADAFTIAHVEKAIRALTKQILENEDAGAGYDPGVSLICVSRKQNLVAAMFSPGVVQLFDIDRRTWQKPLRLELSNPRRIDWSPDDSEIAMIMDDGRVWRIDVRGNKQQVPSQNVLFGNGLAWSPAGKKIAFGGDHGVQVFDVESATTRRLRGLSDVNCVAWSGCGTRLTAGGHNTELWTWDVQTGRTTMNYNRLEQHPFSLEWSPDGQTVAAGGIIANIYLWNACQLERPTLLTPTWGRICINWHPNGQLLASRTRDGDVAIWHVVTRQRLFNFQADQIGSENWGTIVWTRDGTTLVTTGQRRVFLWSLKNRELEVVAAPIDN